MLGVGDQLAGGAGLAAEPFEYLQVVAPQASSTCIEADPAALAPRYLRPDVGNLPRQCCRGWTKTRGFVARSSGPVANRVIQFAYSK